MPPKFLLTLPAPYGSTVWHLGNTLQQIALRTRHQRGVPHLPIILNMTVWSLQFDASTDFGAFQPANRSPSCPAQCRECVGLRQTKKQGPTSQTEQEA